MVLVFDLGLAKKLVNEYGVKLDTFMDNPVTKELDVYYCLSKATSELQEKDAYVPCMLLRNWIETAHYFATQFEENTDGEQYLWSKSLNEKFIELVVEYLGKSFSRYSPEEVDSIMWSLVDLYPVQKTYGYNLNDSEESLINWTKTLESKPYVGLFIAGFKDYGKNDYMVYKNTTVNQYRVVNLSDMYNSTEFYDFINGLHTLLDKPFSPTEKDTAVDYIGALNIIRDIALNCLTNINKSENKDFLDTFLHIVKKTTEISDKVLEEYILGISSK